MKILTAKQIKMVDEYTIQQERISSIDLMERAATKCFQWIENQSFINQDSPIHIFCGLGNNGGDGLALARMLSLEFYKIKCYIVHYSDKMSDDFITNYNRIEEIEIHPHSIHSADDFPVISSDDLVIDAIFGIGLNSEPKGVVKKLIKHINESLAETIAIDVPTGLTINQSFTHFDAIILADYVLTFQLPKLAFLLPDSEFIVNSFEILDIGLNEDYIQTLESDYEYMMRRDLILLYKKRYKFSNKSDYGHAMIIGGSFGKIGSVVLATRAALKIGSGWVTAYIPKCGYQILQTAIPEAMVEVDNENILEFFNPKVKAVAYGIGIGMGTDKNTVKNLLTWLRDNNSPKVLDADAINILSKNKKYLEYLNEYTILTPHSGELERLIGSWEDDFHKMEILKDFTLQYPVIVVVKGAHTMTCHKGKFYFNSTGNPALAKAGSGDVLTGIITGLLAQKYTPLEASLLGVFLHGLAADVYSSLNAPETMMANDIINFLPGAFNAFLNPYLEKPEDFDDNSFDDSDFSDDDDL